ncbi:MAG TPA: phosphatidate cytidylyltransferase [Opitutaceae bacterium]|nr:phosphatidate cytidylyltransferase [Opitutaceae bacterium]
MLKRTITTIVLWLALIGLLWRFGRPAAVILTTLLAVLTQHELYGMLQKMGHRPFRKLGLLLGAAMLLAPYAVRTLGQGHPLSGPGLMGSLMATLMASAVIICCIRLLYERDPAHRFDTLVATVFGIAYVPFMFHFLIEIFFLRENANHGLMLVVWLVAVVKFCDTGALLVGSAIGRHKMSPTISPKKSWEGLIGGVAISAVVGAVLVHLFRPRGLYPENFTVLWSAIAAVPIALLGVVSDLIESMIKRRADIKDSGNTVPGIGGAFDLTDSIILTAPAAYILFAYLLRL